MVAVGKAVPAEMNLGNVPNDRDLLAMAAYANSRNNEFTAGDPVTIINNVTNNTLVPVMTASQQQQQAATRTVVPLQTFAVPNVISQPTLIHQIPISPSPQQILNTISTLPIQVAPTKVLQQNLFVQQQQQQHHHQQIQQLQQQLQLEQLAKIQEVQQHQHQQQQLLLQQQRIQYPVLNVSQQIPLVAPSIPIIHNLIPEHLQPFALAASMNGTTGYAPALILPKNNDQNYVNAVSNMILLAAATSSPVTNATAVAAATQLSAASLAAPQLIPQQQQQQQQQQQPVISLPLTVQDRPTIPPIFNGINLAYPGVEALGVDPPIYLVRDFLTHAECDFLIQAADDVWQPAPVVGKGAGEISPNRTSSTCFLAREDLPDYLRKISALTSKPIEHCELPQVGRYLPTQQYRHHFDAFDLGNEDGRRFAQNGGQRVVTVLVYLNDCAQGGQTDFPVMNLQVAPRKGTAVVFFPATVDGYLDKRALHAALPAIDTKYVSQVWIRQGNYTGTPSKRLMQPMINVSYS